MPTKEITPDPRELAPIEDALHQSRAGLQVLDASVERLLETAFRNGPLAYQRLGQVVRHHGVDQAVATLENRNPMRGREHIGFLRGSLLSPRRLREAREALAELTPTLRQMLQLKNKIADLEKARHRLIDRADQARLRSNTPDRPRPRDRGRKRSDF